MLHKLEKSFPQFQNVKDSNAIRVVEVASIVRVSVCGVMEQ
jgi:hypothetical protein